MNFKYSKCPTIIPVQNVEFNEFEKKSYRLSIVYNKQYNRYLLEITRKFNYTINNETKEGFCKTYLNFTAAKKLVD